MIDEGVAGSAMVVDAVAVGTGLFPRLRGGPMFLADRRGLMIVRASLDELAEHNPALYRPSPLILRLLHQGRGFAALN
jgi:3-hydroxyacyl-CoA dehydrogenase